MADGDTQKAKPRAPEGMAGLAKGLAIIELFQETHDAVTVSSAAQAVGISRASARRCMMTLMDLGFLAKNGSRFSPTPRMLRLGASYAASPPLPQLAQHYLEAARNELHESVSLSILEDGYSVFVARAEVERLVSMVVRIGSRLPAYASATGRVLLSALSDSELDHYLDGIEPKALTSRTITETGHLRDVIKAVRTDRVAISDQELEEGMLSIAIPVTDPEGKVVAAMSLSASSARVPTERMLKEMLPGLRMHADALSRAL